MGVGVAWGRVPQPAAAGSAPRLYVFVPAVERPRAVGEILSEGLSGVAVTAFGRFADFSAAVASEKPEGALALADTLQVMGIQPALQGSAAGSTREPYVLLAKDPADTIESLSKKVIGAVDVVGRAALPLLVQRVLGGGSLPNVRRVLNVGDLLALLHLDLAPAVLLPERFQGELKKQSRLELRTLRPVTQLGRVALGYPSGRAERALASALRHASASTQSLLGTETWQ